MSCKKAVKAAAPSQMLNASFASSDGSSQDAQTQTGHVDLGGKALQDFAQGMSEADGCVGGFLVLSLSIPAFEAAGLVYLSQLAIGQRFGLGSLRIFRAGCFQDPKETKL